MHRPLALLLSSLLAHLVSAQQPTLKVEAEPQNVVASRLVGSWRADDALCQRLGTKAPAATLAFRSDESWLGNIPARMQNRLKDRRIYWAGTMTLRGTDYPSLLIEIHGNPHVVYFRERDGNPMGDTESFNLALAPGAKSEQDLLLVGGDFNNQPFAAYARDPAPARPAGGTLQAAIAEMLDLLQQGEHVRLIETYATPADLKRMTDGGETVAQIADEFARKKAVELRQGLEKAANMEPRYNADRTEAVFDGPGFGKPIRLQRIADRWYLGN